MTVTFGLSSSTAARIAASVSNPAIGAKPSRTVPAMPAPARWARSAARHVELTAAGRGLGYVEARGGPAEMEFLRDGEEVAEQTRLEIDSPRLTVTPERGLGRRRRTRLALLPTQRSATEGGSSP
jgi:hypothetical protein